MPPSMSGTRKEQGTPTARHDGACGNNGSETDDDGPAKPLAVLAAPEPARREAQGRRPGPGLPQTPHSTAAYTASAFTSLHGSSQSSFRPLALSGPHTPNQGGGGFQHFAATAQDVDELVLLTGQSVDRLRFAAQTTTATTATSVAATTTNTTATAQPPPPPLPGATTRYCDTVLAWKFAPEAGEAAPDNAEGVECRPMVMRDCAEETFCARCSYLFAVFVATLYTKHTASARSTGTPSPPQPQVPQVPQPVPHHATNDSSDNSDSSDDDDDDDEDDAAADKEVVDMLALPRDRPGPSTPAVRPHAVPADDCAHSHHHHAHHAGVDAVSQCADRIFDTTMTPRGISSAFATLPRVRDDEVVKVDRATLRLFEGSSSSGSSSTAAGAQSPMLALGDEIGVGQVYIDLHIWNGEKSSSFTRAAAFSKALCLDRAWALPSAARAACLLVMSRAAVEVRAPSSPPSPRRQSSTTSSSCSSPSSSLPPLGGKEYTLNDLIRSKLLRAYHTLATSLGHGHAHAPSPLRGCTCLPSPRSGLGQNTTREASVCHEEPAIPSRRVSPPPTLARPAPAPRGPVLPVPSGAARRAPGSVPKLSLGGLRAPPPSGASSSGASPAATPGGRQQQPAQGGGSASAKLRMPFSGTQEEQQQQPSAPRAQSTRAEKPAAFCPSPPRTGGVPLNVLGRSVSGSTLIPRKPALPMTSLGESRRSTQTTSTTPTTTVPRLQLSTIPRTGEVEDVPIIPTPPETVRDGDVQDQGKEQGQEQGHHGKDGSDHERNGGEANGGMRRYRGIVSKIDDQLYLTGEAGAQDLGKLRALGVERVLNVADGVCHECHAGQFRYLSIDLEDNGAKEDLRPLFLLMIDFVEQGRTVLHCQQGVSRSATFVIAYVMWKNGFTFRHALDYVTKRRPVVSPNGGFMGQLLLWEALLRNSRSAVEGAPPRLLRVVTHPGSSHEVVMVGQEVAAVARASLDPRGSFVLHSPATRTVHVWLGSACTPQLAAGAAGLCELMRKYLWVETVLEERQGYESDAFWHTLRDHPGAVAPVAAYDRDYAARAPGLIYRFAAWDPVELRPAPHQHPRAASAVREQGRRQVWVYYRAPGDVAVSVPHNFLLRVHGREIADTREIATLVCRLFCLAACIPEETPFRLVSDGTRLLDDWLCSCFSLSCPSS